MAYEVNILDKDKLKQQEGEGGEAVKKLSQTSDVLTPGGVADPSNLGTTQPKAEVGGGQNVSQQQKYLDANRQKSHQLAENAGGVIRGDVDVATGSLTGAGEQFGQDVERATVRLDQDLYGQASRALSDQTAEGYSGDLVGEFMGGDYQEGVSEAKGYEDWIGSTYPQQEPIVQPAEQNPVPGEIPGTAPGVIAQGETPQYQTEYDEYLAGFTPQEQITNKQAFQDQYNAQYGGARNIANQDYYVQARRDKERAMSTAGLTEDQTGRQELISRTYDPSGRYSAGSLALDESLLTSSPEAMEALRQASDYSLTLEDLMGNIESEAGTAYEEGVATTEATRQAMRDQFSLGGEEQEIRTETEAIKNQAQKDYEEYLQYIQENYGVQEGVQATSYFDSPQDWMNIQAQNVATEEDYGRMAALEELTGGISTLTPFSDQAGQSSLYTNPEEDFRLTDFEGKVGSEKELRYGREEAERKRLEAIFGAEQAAKKAAEDAEKKAQATAIGTAVGAGAGAVVGSIVPGVGTAAGAIVGGAIGGVIGGSVFCFDGDSEFLMEDGTYKKIKDIELRDVMAEGGEIYSISKHSLNSPLYSYPTDGDSLVVTGTHAVHENGKWVRIENSIKACSVESDIKEVYCLSNQYHRMISNGVTFADYAEIDNDQGLTDDQCLRLLNR